MAIICYNNKCRAEHGWGNQLYNAEVSPAHPWKVNSLNARRGQAIANIINIQRQVPTCAFHSGNYVGLFSRMLLSPLRIRRGRSLHFCNYSKMICAKTSWKANFLFRDFNIFKEENSEWDWFGFKINNVRFKLYILDHLDPFCCSISLVMTMVILKVWVVLLSDQAYTENRPALEWSKQIWLLQGGFQESPLPVECNHIESQLCSCSRYGFFELGWNLTYFTTRAEPCRVGYIGL